uniref:contactin-associated protein-like 4 n=1 Tax=Styela clava TaxID=7725 RepID=UPI0019395147|nr:contactin-associated protein-like 4 [Styela clava]
MTYNKFILLIVILKFWSGVICQSQKNIQIPSDKSSCGVVNVNCASGQGTTVDCETGTRLYGPPGKRGPAGATGPRGPKGNTGSQGPKGKPGNSVNVEEIKNQIMKQIGAHSCEDLTENHGVTKSGFYILRSIETSQLNYIYCSFEPGITTCNQLRNSQGVNETGLYIVRPEASLPSFKIFCKFSLRDAITEIWHDNMNEIEVDGNCESPGCYTWTPNYSLNQGQIVSIISISRECRQFVKFRCKGVLLFRDGHGHWVSRTGQKMRYWGGSTSMRGNYCACGENGNCVDNRYKCNCDNNQIKILTSDEGYLTDKTVLPLKEVGFGDNGDAGEKAWFTIGKLECMG